MPRFLTRTARGREPEQTQRRPVCLVVTGGPDAGARFALEQGTAVVGTFEGCQLRLTDPTASRQHVAFELKPQGLHATDLHSRNGTLFDGSRIKEAFIPIGARLRLGDTELRVDPLGAEQPLPGARAELHGLTGNSPAMREAIEKLARAAKSDATVLLEGETGTGKELAARALHQESGRKGKLVVFDCGSAGPELIASDLFGHAKGAFTGAHVARSGAAEEARGGTLFLDEIGELDVSLQPALLRLLEAREVRPVGANRSKKLDVRVVAATHRDLAAEVARGRFRQDLFYRLSVVSVRLPPLRERLDDLPLLAKHLLEAAGHAGELPPAALATLGAYAWPGNVRELRNVLVRSVELGDGVEPLPEAAAGGEAEAALPLDYREARVHMLARFEREYLLNLLAKHGRNVRQAAMSAGVARGHLYRLLKRHGLV